MNPKLYWVDGPWPGKLAISARPRGGGWLTQISGARGLPVPETEEQWAWIRDFSVRETPSPAPLTRASVK
jgi:hypothetical protein